jgi:butyryl-CoA dehydrogenase
MRFQLTKEQEMVRKMVREFAENEIKPIAAEFDETQEFPWDTVKKMGELNLLGLIFPKEYGGAGVDYVSYTIAVEEVSRVCGAHGITVAAHNSLCSNHIYIAGSEEQKQKFLVPLAKGEKIGAWGLTEPNAGSDAGATQTNTSLHRQDEETEGHHRVYCGKRHTRILTRNQGEQAGSKGQRHCGDGI